MGEIRIPARTAGAAWLACAILLTAGCGKDDAPTAPAGTNPIIPIAAADAWPHENGRAFEYRFVARAATTPSTVVYPTPGEVPGVTLDQVAALLETPPSFTLVQETTSGYVLTFQDSMTTGSGVRGQALLAAVTPYPIPVATRARPPGTAAANGVFGVPRLLRGGTWRLDGSRIGLYGEASTEPVWIYLDGSLADRTAWQARLLPGLADDVVMRARAWQTVNVDVAGFRREDALDVHYLMDYGVTAVTDENGSVFGYTRRFDYGRVVWAPGVGPVYVYERDGLTAADPPTSAVSEATLLLENVSLPQAFTVRD